MSQSFTISATVTFTLTHARHLGAKVATDLKRIQRFYDQPNDQRITEFEGEVVELLRNGYLGEVIYGFQRNNMWIAPTLRYTANDIAHGGLDDDPGRVSSGQNIVGAQFTSFLTYSAAWYCLSQHEKEDFKKTLPIQRISGEASQVEGGYFAADNTYSSGGRSLGRSSIRSYQ